MDRCRSRRAVLKQAVTLGTAVGVSSTVATSVAASTSVVKGRLVAADGAPIAGRKVYIFVHDGHSGYHKTDDKGRFEIEIESGSSYTMALYKSGSSLLAPVRNGVPHVYGLGDYSGAQDHGEIQVPRGYLVRMRALDQDSTPVADADPGMRHDGFGIGSSYMTTRADGWAYISGADFASIEAHGDTKFSMAIPTDGDGSMLYETRVTVDGALDLVFQLGTGVTVTRRNTTPTGTATPTRERTASPTPTTSATATETPVSTQDTTRSSAHSPTVTRTPDRQPSATVTHQTRGFFSNETGGGSDLSPLSNPMTVTLGGFAASIAGVARQLFISP